jgi:hypothetical protein
MAKPDLVGDLTRAGRLLKKVTQGEMSLGELFGFGAPEQGAAVAAEGAETCQKTAGCICTPNHEGGCCFAAVAE